MNPSERKADRLAKIEMLLLAHPEGMSQATIARCLGVHRSTINHYIPNLPGPVFIGQGNRWYIDSEAYLVNVRFTLHEALAVHLAARLLATRMDRQNQHAAAALRKLGVAIQTLAPRIARHLQRSADLMDDTPRSRDPVYLAALEKLTLAWANGQKARIWHRHEPDLTINEYLFSPYFIEPYAIGQTTYVIGLREPPGLVRTFKIERIERVEITRQPYEVPADFNPGELLANAWGIWYTEFDPVDVRLRFSARVARRVCETCWHRSEEVTEQPDGSLLWKACVAEPLEMLNWIRGWGSDVEVLEPQGLRERMREDTQTMVKIYGG